MTDTETKPRRISTVTVTSSKCDEKMRSKGVTLFTSLHLSGALAQLK